MEPAFIMSVFIVFAPQVVALLTVLYTVIQCQLNIISPGKWGSLVQPCCILKTLKETVSREFLTLFFFSFKAFFWSD